MVCVVNDVDPDQMVSSETSLSGSVLFSKVVILAQQDKG